MGKVEIDILISMLSLIGCVNFRKIFKNLLFRNHKVDQADIKHTCY